MPDYQSSFYKKAAPSWVSPTRPGVEAAPTISDYEGQGKIQNERLRRSLINFVSMKYNKSVRGNSVNYSIKGNNNIYVEFNNHYSDDGVDIQRWNGYKITIIQDAPLTAKDYNDMNMLQKYATRTSPNVDIELTGG